MIPSLLVLLPLSAVQAAPAAGVLEARTLSHGAGLARQDEGVVALGDGWKARLEPGRVVWTPYLGVEAPRNLPIAIEVDSILRGDEVVWAPSRFEEPVVDAGGAPLATYDRGGGVLERYEARPAGLAQSFVIDAAPGAGELTVRLRLATDLQLRGGGGAERLRFGYADLREVSIGAVTGIDANGATRGGELRLAPAGDVLDLVLPADFVEDAAWPLVVDPIFGPEGTVEGSAGNSAPDIARSSSLAGGYLAVWSVTVSVLDFDIVGRAILDDGTVGPLVSYESEDDIIAVNPRVSGPKSGANIVAWEAGTGLFAGTDIQARTQALFGLGPVTDITTTPESETHLDLGADWGVGVPMVYEVIDNGVRCSMLLPGGGLSPGPVTVVETQVLSTADTDTYPDVSEHALGDEGGMVVWMRKFPMDNDIMLRRYLSTGWAPEDALFTIGPDERFPTVDGLVAGQAGGGFGVAYVRDEIGSVRFRPLTINDNGTVDFEDEIAGLVTGHSDIELTYTGYGYVTSSRTGNNLQMLLFDALAGNSPEADGFSANFQSSVSPTGRIAARGGVAEGPSAEGYVVYEDDGAIRGRAWEDDMQLELIDASCGGGFMYPSKLRHGETAHYRLRGAQPISFGQLAIGFAEGFGFLCGDCRIVPAVFPNPILVNFAIPATGEFDLALPVPNDSALIGLALYTQFLSFHAVNPACTLWNLEVTDAFRQVID